jgi:hypothetical protein
MGAAASRRSAYKNRPVLPLPLLMADGEFLVVGLRQLGDEAGGTLESLGADL